MAKRRKLEAPSAADLDKIEEGFRSETSGRPGMAPIAQVASESAAQMHVATPEQRRSMAELDKFRKAEDRGLVAKDIPINAIDPKSLTRDRVTLDPDEFEELKASVAKNGLRMPIEVYSLPYGGEKAYGLISGYRRFLAMQQVGQETIPAFVRSAEDDDSDRTEAMVEENEIRANLSHYERGRIAVLSVQNGPDPDVETAVNRLFGFASKAKRSKVRSFATIYEELGDVLNYPKELTERQGLKLSNVLKAGHANTLREALARSIVATPVEEWRVLEVAMTGLKAPAKPESGGRPKAAPKHAFETEAGVRVTWHEKNGQAEVSISGRLDREAEQKLLSFIHKL